MLQAQGAIAHGGLGPGVTEQVLDLGQGYARLGQVGCGGVAEAADRKVDAQGAGGGPGEASLDDAVVIQVLLTLVRHPGSGPAQVVRRLRGHATPITSQQVHAVFTRFDLGEKGGPSKR